MSLEFIAANEWVNAEVQLADGLGLELRPMSETGLEAINREVEAGVFDADQILEVFKSDPRAVLDFGRRLHLVTYAQVLGQSTELEQGALVNYCLFYLYARDKPERLTAYLELIGVSGAAQVSADILRVYAGEGPAL